MSIAVSSSFPVATGEGALDSGPCEYAERSFEREGKSCGRLLSAAVQSVGVETNGRGDLATEVDLTALDIEC